MRRDLRNGMLLSFTIHGALCFPSLGLQPTVDVERGQVSLEVELFSEVQAALPETLPRRVLSTPDAESWRQDAVKPQTSQDPSVQAVSGHGAFIEAKPVGVANRPPAYPWIARMRGWEGVVELRVSVESTGRPSTVQVVKRSGYPTLDLAAQRAVGQWRFTPATRGGHAVRSELEFTVRFQLLSDEGGRVL